MFDRRFFLEKREIIPSSLGQTLRLARKSEFIEDTFYLFFSVIHKCKHIHVFIGRFYLIYPFLIFIEVNCFIFGSSCRLDSDMF